MARQSGEDVHETSSGKKDDLIAVCLAKGMKRHEAAAHAKVSLRTVYNKLAKPEFRALLRSHQKQLIDSAYGELADGLRPIVRKLKRLAESKDPKIVIAASKTLGALFIRVGVFHAQEERLTALEAAMREKGRG